ncbi:hypothetical protein DFH09DRAFT_1412117 [Mycena vulgaris]|nr:hypothetical protein DFH09DRAFT_1412117 [Mycena vulgaris]
MQRLRVTCAGSDVGLRWVLKLTDVSNTHQLVLTFGYSLATGKSIRLSPPREWCRQNEIYGCGVNIMLKTLDEQGGPAVVHLEREACSLALESLSRIRIAAKSKTLQFQSSYRGNAYQTDRIVQSCFSASFTAVGAKGVLTCVRRRNLTHDKVHGIALAIVQLLCAETVSRAFGPISQLLHRDTAGFLWRHQRAHLETLPHMSRAIGDTEDEFQAALVTYTKAGNKTAAMRRLWNAAYETGKSA